MTSPVAADLREALQQLATRRPIVVALDFDGVLAPLVARPEDARPLPASAAAVRRLLAVDDVHVALVSGRHLDSLRVVAEPPAGVVLIASHGAEVDGAPPPQVPRETLDAVRDALATVSAAHAGTTVEHKPTAAVLHTRGAVPEVAEAATAAALRAVDPIDGADAMLGKQVVEVAVVRADKGTALRDLRERVGAVAAFYAGDDTTDENAFRTLDPAVGDVGVKVGGGETAAGFRVDAPEDVAGLLTLLADRLG